MLPRQPDVDAQVAAADVAAQVAAAALAAFAVAAAAFSASRVETWVGWGTRLVD